MHRLLKRGIRSVILNRPQHSRVIVFDLLSFTPAVFRSRWQDLAAFRLNRFTSACQQHKTFHNDDNETV